MRNQLTFLIIALVAGPVLAQQDPELVGNIIDELMNYSETQAPAVERAAPVVAEKKPAPTSRPVKTQTIRAVVEEDHEPVSGDIEAALQISRKLVGIPSESIAARLYPRTLLERDQRTVEIDGMDAVHAAWSTEMVLRSYTLVAGAGERMKLGDVTSSVDVKALFPNLDFPKDSSAFYQPKKETLFVRNTLENLAVMETMLETMGVLRGFDNAEQIEIESKFVEVSEGALEELGFQWNFADSTHAGIGGADLDVVDGAGGLFSEALRGSPNNSSAGSLPFDRQVDLGDGTRSASGNWSTFRFEDTFKDSPSELNLSYTGNNPFDVLISALDQSTGADVLSAPRILTRSGEEATIRVGEIHYFPEVFEGGTSEATLPNISYEDFEEKLLGVELTVTPKVTGEHEITLRLNPRISELAGWQNYQLAPANSIYNHRYDYARERYIHPALVAKLPIFKKREIETEVTIADGSTIGMGGLISEKIEAFEDKVPVLGSIPLVGRLFRNEGERAVKRNLLMFVTARIIEPNGRINTSRSFE